MMHYQTLLNPLALYYMGYKFRTQKSIDQKGPDSKKLAEKRE